MYYKRARLRGLQASSCAQSTQKHQHTACEHAPDPGIAECASARVLYYFECNLLVCIVRFIVWNDFVLAATVRTFRAPSHLWLKAASGFRSSDDFRRRRAACRDATQHRALTLPCVQAQCGTCTVFSLAQEPARPWPWPMSRTQSASLLHASSRHIHERSHTVRLPASSRDAAACCAS